ncbi:MAG: hypothetical protein IBJ00_03115 [Alphaproteobacteria bacterium]|nr:hypothetical protein [Alphaproteobacteria bacterium]
MKLFYGIGVWLAFSYLHSLFATDIQEADIDIQDDWLTSSSPSSGR